MNEMGERLRLAREAAGYASGRSAAAMHDWNPNTYKAHESGANGFKPMQAAEYAQAFGTTTMWLLTGEGDPPRASKREPQKRSSLPPANASKPFAMSFNGNRDLPVYGVAVGGDDGKFRFNGEEVDRVERPPALVGVSNSYGVFVSGESMSPRYEPGETVWVHPGRPPRRGDDVVVQLHPEVEGEPPEGYIKRFVTWTPGRLVLLQFNPQSEIEFDRALVRSVHVIIGAQRV